MNVTATLLGFLGAIFLLSGFVLILGGAGIIDFQQIKITKGASTLIFGIIIVILGGLLLIPQVKADLSSSVTPTPNFTDEPTLESTVTGTPTPMAISTSLPTATSTSVLTSTLAVFALTTTDTPLPTAISTPFSTSTATLEPPTSTSTNTPVSTATDTPQPIATNTPTTTPTNTPIPTNTLTPVPLTCSFIDELVSKGQVTQILQGGNGAAGVQVGLSSPVDVPVGWTVHNNGQEYKGPVHFDAGTFASFWAPDLCQPLRIPSEPANANVCAFIDELVKKGEIAQILQGGKGAAGVQIRLSEGVDVPPGWTVHNQGKLYSGPVHFDAGTFASFWAPSWCEPLTISPPEQACASITFAQIKELTSIQESAEAAITQAETFAGYRQNDYVTGFILPEGIMIATNLLSSELSQFGVLPVNNQGGFGLFVTTRSVQAPNNGTYWCIEDATIAEIKGIAPFCAFVTRNQVEDLKLTSDPATAIRKAEALSGHRQNNYATGATVPSSVLVATNLHTSNVEEFGVVRVSSQGGYGLFETTQEFSAPNDGTYWCIH